MLHIELLKSHGCAACTRATEKVRRMLDWVREAFPVVQIEEIDISEQRNTASPYDERTR